jgi:eukaryotic-like serine/threonine-protein kinase
MSDAPRTSPARTFGRFRVSRRLGAGGMGEVFLARDELLGRDVAIKTLSVPGFEAAAGEEFRARFLNEARAIAALSHANVVQVFDLGFEGETPYLVMEVVGGPSLRDRLKEGRRLSFSEARALGIQLGGALGAAHARGIIHRDVKPANLLEAEPGVWKLADFGVARTPDSTLTAAGQFLGSPAYAAPEALLLAKFSAASDVFGLGATLYEALCGETPFGDPRQAELADVVKGRQVIDIGVRCPGIPAELASAVMKAIAHDASERPTAAELVEILAGGGAAAAAPAPAPAASPAAAPAGAATRPGVPSALQAAASASVAAPRVSSLGPRASIGPPRTARGWLIAAVIAGALVVVGLGVGFGTGAFLSRGDPPASPDLGSRAADARPPFVAAPVAPALPVPAPAPEPAPVDAAAPATPAVDAARAAARDAAPLAPDSRRAREEQWRRIELAHGKGGLDEARRELEDYVKRYPDDKRGAELLENLKAMPPGLGGTR